jgi:hypothetical protein
MFHQLHNDLMTATSCSFLLNPTPSDVQGFVNPQGSRGKGQEGKGQGKDFITLNKP